MSQSKLLLTTAMLLAGALPALADGRIVLDPKEGGSPAYAEMTTLTKVSFSPTGIIITNGDAAEEFAYATVSKLRLETGIYTGISQVMPSAGKLKLRQNPVESTLEVLGYDGEPTAFNVVNLAGVNCMSLKAWEGEPVDVAHLPQGIYLITVNNETLKFIKK